MNLVPIPTTLQQLQIWAPHWLPFLPGIARRSKEPVAELIRRIGSLETQIALIWDGEKAHALIEFRYHRRGDELIAEIISTTGSGMKAWQHLLPQVEQYLTEHVGCTEIRPICRPGWSRLLRQHGYKITHYVMEKRHGR